MSITMCHYMRSVKKSRTSKRGHSKTPHTTPTGKRQRNQALSSGTPLGLFGVLPREMRFGIFGFTRPVDLGRLSLTSRKFRDEVIDFIHNSDALPIIVPKVHFNDEKDSAEVFITMETEYCCNHFRQLGKLYLKMQQLLKFANL